MKRIYQICLLATAFLITLQVQAQDHKKWSAGARTGVSQEFNSLAGQYNNSNRKMRNLTTGLHNQLFVNKQLGKRSQWMLELNTSYFAYSSESSYMTFPPQQINHEYYALSKRHNLGLQFNARHLVYECKPLKWQHYVGLNLNLNTLITQYRTYESINNGSPLIMAGRERNHNHLYAGLDYSGRILLSPKLSIQYVMNYSLIDPNYSLTFNGLNPLGMQYARHKMTGNAGIGWHF